MDPQSRQQRNIERLEQKRQLINKRLEHKMKRINEHFDQVQAKLDGKLNIKQEQIIAAALELLSEDGLASITLRDIAKRTHMQAPALYWHFKNKEELVDHMAEAILDKELHDMQPRCKDEPWQDWLIGHMQQLRKAMLAYPDGGRVVAGAHLYPAVSLGKSLEYSLVSLMSAGVDLQTARHVALAATHYTFGFVIEEQAAPTQEQMEGVDVEVLLAPYPTLKQMISETQFGPDTADEDFLIGLQYIIAGSTQTS